MTALITKGIFEILPNINLISLYIKSTSSLVESMSNGVKKVSYTDKEALEYIDSLDIRNKLELYNILISEIKDTQSQSISHILIYIKNAILDIELTLITIDNKITHNKSLKILHNFRSYSVISDLKRLEKYIKILDQRIDMLKNISQIRNANINIGYTTQIKHTKKDENIDNFFVEDFYTIQ